MSDRNNAVETIDAGHSVMIRKPQELANIINRICARHRKTAVVSSSPR